MSSDLPELTGYRRHDGRVGFRNHVVVVPLAGCVQEIVNRIAAGVDGAVAFTQPLGCDLLDPDAARLENILFQLSTSPNVGGALFVTLGCAAVNKFRLPRRAAAAGRLTERLDFQQEGGTTACVRKGQDQARAMVDKLAADSREPVPVSAIVLGTKCGASDKTSFTTCHPILGSACDRLVDMGASVVLSEDHELLAGIDALKARAASAAVADRIQAVADRLAARMRARGGPGVDVYLETTPETRKASLAHMAKAGTRPVVAVTRLGESVSTAGLVVLDAPNSDLISMTSLAAAGCNLLAFTTGRGTAAASPVLPTLKLTANPSTFERLRENTDLLVGEEDPSSADRILAALFRLANGELSRGEQLGHGEMFIPLDGVTF